MRCGHYCGCSSYFRESCEGGLWLPGRAMRTYKPLTARAALAAGPGLCLARLPALSSRRIPIDTTAMAPAIAPAAAMAAYTTIMTFPFVTWAFRIAGLLLRPKARDGTCSF
jgi:hypothetical protein